MSASIIVFPENTEFLSSGEKAGSWQKVNYLELINCYVSYKIFQEIVTQRLKLSMMSPNTFLDILLLISFHISLTLESLWGLLEYPNRAAPAPLPSPGGSPGTHGVCNGRNKALVWGRWCLCLHNNAIQRGLIVVLPASPHCVHKVPGPQLPQLRILFAM